MTGVAFGFSAEEVPSRLLVRAQNGLLGRSQSRVELRRKRADVRRGLVRCDRQRVLVVGGIRRAAVLGLEVKRTRIRSKRGGGSVTDPPDILRPLNRKSLRAPNASEDMGILSSGDSVRNTGRIRQTHLLCIVRRALRLLSIGALEPITGRAQVPEVTPVEVALRLVI